MSLEVLLKRVKMRLSVACVWAQMLAKPSNSNLLSM